jgi:hypothetical protein
MPQQPQRGNRDRGGTDTFKSTVPSHPYDLILARPEKTSVTLSVLTYGDMEGYVAYGIGASNLRTPVKPISKGVPVEFVLDSLQPDTRYSYRFCSRSRGGQRFAESPEFTFHTARPSGGSFTFTMTADAHLDGHTSLEVYDQTLANIRADNPDFHIDLGNLFMTDKHADRDDAGKQYLAQRYHLGLIGSSVPLFLALGTHDGESSRYDDGSADCLAVWAGRMRRQYFPNPVSDGFYSGDPASDPRFGALQDYYSWEWGDALFVVLDPFRYSVRQRGSNDGWGWSLGSAQYKWLEETLSKSHAKFRFVFIHNLLTGDQASRGGVEVARFNEWGGKNLDGSDGFTYHRPGWDMPIHQLLVRNHVAVVFKAHDNFFARQDLDGIVYQMIPQPSFAGDDRIRDLENYGYKQGTFLGNSGHIRVTVTPEGVRVEYVRSVPEGDQAGAQRNGEVAYSYTVERR